MPRVILGWRRCRGAILAVSKIPTPGSQLSTDCVWFEAQFLMRMAKFLSVLSPWFGDISSISETQKMQQKMFRPREFAFFPILPRSAENRERYCALLSRGIRLSMRYRRNVYKPIELNFQLKLSRYDARTRDAQGLV